MENGLEIIDRGINQEYQKNRAGTFRDKMKILRDKYSYLVLTFTIPLLIMWTIYIIMGVYPFGNNSVLVLDLNGQYVYFFEELREKLLSGGNLLYTWSRSLGGEFMGIFAYYVASPFALLTLIFPKDHITEALLCMILLKTGSMGLSMGIYLHNSHPSKKINIVIFSCMYALTAYAVVQAHNTMWIDNLIMLPLLTLGIENLITKRRFKLFVITLSVAVLTNFYIGYMMCIYVAVYFIYYYFAHNVNDENNFYMERRHFIKSIARIAVYSAIAISIAMVIIYPTYYSLQFGKTEFSQTSYDVYEKFSFLDMFYKLFPGSYDTVRPEGLPFLYCGILTLLLLPVYFFSNGVKAREKMCTAGIIAFFLFSFNCSVIDIVWHGLQKPNWLNYRYSFMLCFILLITAYKAFCNFSKSNYRIVIFTATLLIGGLLAAQVQKHDYIRDIDCVWISIICIVIICFALHAFRYGYIGSGAKSILLIAVCLELFLSGLVNTIALDEDVVISSRDSYNNYISEMQPLVDYVKNYDNSPFYRMEKTNHRKTNDSMALGYYGISGSTSTLNSSVISLLADLGYTSKSHWSKYVGGNIISDSLVGIKYVITDEDRYDNDYQSIFNGNVYSIYKNGYAVSLAAAVNEKYQTLDLEQYATAFDFLDAIVGSMIGKEGDTGLFTELILKDTNSKNCDISNISGHKKYKVTKSSVAADITYTVEATADGDVYMFLPTDYSRELRLTVNGNDYGIYLNEGSCMKYIGTYSKGDLINVVLTLKEDDCYIKNGTTMFCTMNKDAVYQALSDISSNQYEITSFSDTHIEGVVTTTEEKNTLYTSIPYDKGWHVYVDGEETTIFKTAGALLTAELEPGTHTVVFKYLPDSFVIGAIVTVCGLAAFAAAVAVDRIYTRRRRMRWALSNRAYH